MCRHREGVRLELFIRFFFRDNLFYIHPPELDLARHRFKGVDNEQRGPNVSKDGVLVITGIDVVKQLWIVQDRQIDHVLDNSISPFQERLG